MSEFLTKIIEDKREVVRKKKPFYASLRVKIEGQKFSRYHIFKQAISRPGQVNLIAEIKKASPSQGLIREDFHLLSIAKAYVEHGAAALSILTEEQHFLGKPGYVKQVTEQFQIPVLQKDFIIDEDQILESFCIGASAILLIVAALEDAQLKLLMSRAAEVDLDCLVEVHDQNELDRALAAGADIIGINNRNLHTFEVNLETSRNLIPKIPKGKVIVVESGIKSNADVRMFQEMGVHALLIGETFMRAYDIGAKVDDVMKGSHG